VYVQSYLQFLVDEDLKISVDGKIDILVIWCQFYKIINFVILRFNSVSIFK